MVNILPAAPHGTTDQMSPDRAAVPYVDVAQLAAEGSASESDVLTAFAEARAASALAAALGPDPVFAAQEAAYEAHCAIADGSNVLAFLSEAIDA